jgi:hypothetical protein
MDKGIKTEDAYARMINLRAIFHELEVDSSTARHWRKNVNDHPNEPEKWGITKNKMEELLKKTGHKVIQEKLWTSVI